MQEVVTAKLNELRMAPRKTRLVGDSIRGLSVPEAEAQLMLSPRKAAKPLLKLVQSAIANARHNKKIAPERLFIKEIRVDGGPMLKRWTPRARGSVGPIQKKTSNITLVLGVMEREAAVSYRLPRLEKKKEKHARVEKKERAGSGKKESGKRKTAPKAPVASRAKTHGAPAKTSTSSGS